MPRKTIAHLSCTTSSFVHHLKPIGEYKTGVTVQKSSIWTKIGDLLSCVTLKFDGWPWKNNRAPLLCYFKLCKSFQSHWWIQTGVTVLKRSIRLKITDICPLQLWPWNLMDDLKKPKGHVFYATSRFEHHFTAICEFKLELQSEKSQFGSKSIIFLALWPWNWWMTLKNNRAPLLCYFKRYASFHSHLWI